MLLIRILAYNTSEYSTTKRTLVFANKGFNTDVLLETQKYEKLVPYAVTKRDKIYEL